MIPEMLREALSRSYHAVFAVCSCGHPECHAGGWLVVGPDDWRAPRVMGPSAAALASDMLNAGRITPDELTILWAVGEDEEDDGEEGAQWH